MQLARGRFPLKGIAKEIMNLGTGTLVGLNDGKTIARSEMLHLRKIEGVLIQSRYVCTMWQTILPLALTIIIEVKGSKTPALSAARTSKKIACSQYVFYLVSIFNH